jgi:chaperonin GroES
MNIKPLYDRVVVRRLEAEKTTSSGIILPGSAAEEPNRGEVVSVGQGAISDDGSIRELAVKAGDVVLFSQYAGTEVKLGDDTLLVMKESDILVVVDEATEVEEKVA